jgi:uncharacterized protein (DUF488 family)
MKIWTIGHSTRSMEQFTGMLQAHGMEALADVRTFPGSRRYPHFNQEPLARSLAEASIGYHHFLELGGRRKSHPDSANLAWRHPAFRGYADHMETAEFQNGMNRLCELARENRTAIMCSEAVWWRCHRSLISDYLKAAGWEVLHIFDVNKIEEHPFTSAARLVEGRLSYRLLI